MAKTTKTDKGARVQRFKLDDLVGQDDNPKKHDLDVIKVSLREYGYVELVAWDTHTKRLVAGHGRVEALKLIRAAVESGELDERGEPWKVPKHVDVVEGEWTIDVITKRFRSKAQARAYVVTSNRSSELGGWGENYDEYLSQFRDDDLLVSAMGFESEMYSNQMERFDTLKWANNAVSTGDSSTGDSSTGDSSTGDSSTGGYNVDEENITISFVVSPSQQTNIEQAIKRMRTVERGLRGSMLATICKRWNETEGKNNGN